TVYRDIDTAKGSVYDQFEDNPFLFSPEEGRHDLYDDQFTKLASRQATNYSDGFPNDKLAQIDAVLSERDDKPADEKLRTVHRILSLSESDTAPKQLSLYHEYQPHDTAEVNQYLNGLGYQLFTENGKVGFKK